jgi:hypothetical protein
LSHIIGTKTAALNVPLHYFTDSLSNQLREKNQPFSMEEDLIFARLQIGGK